MRILRYLLPFVLLLIPTTAHSGYLPPDCDSWSEYSDAGTAQADGWLRECGLSQQVATSTDCMVGTYSVGCRTTRAYWCDEFGYEQTASLVGATNLSFWHKADWADWNFAVRIYMQPTETEASQGVTVKRLVFNFPSSTSWTENSFELADGQWEWRENNMWRQSGYEETLTELISVQWYFCRYYGVAIGDEMLIDGLCLTMEDSAVPPNAGLVRLLAPSPNPFNPTTDIGFVLEQPRYLKVAIYDMAGSLVKLLGEGNFNAGPHNIPWRGRDERNRNMPSGVYFVRLDSEGIYVKQKLVLIR